MAAPMWWRPLDREVDDMTVRRIGLDARTLIARLESHRRHFGHGYRQWRVGITDDNARRWQEHGHPPCWFALKAESEATARAVEEHFLACGMEGGRGGRGHGGFVYVF